MNANKGERELEDNKIIEFKKPHLAVDNTVTPINWLLELPIGCVFLTRMKGHTDAGLFMTVVTAKREQAVEICQETLSTDSEWSHWVDSVRFSNQWEKFEVISYGSGDRTD